MCVLCWDSRRVWNGNTEETLPLAAEFGRKLKKRKQLTPQFYIRVLRILHSCTRAAHSTRLDSSMMQLTQKYDAVFHGRQDILYFCTASSFIVVFLCVGVAFVWREVHWTIRNLAATHKTSPCHPPLSGEGFPSKTVWRAFPSGGVAQVFMVRFSRSSSLWTIYFGPMRLTGDLLKTFPQGMRSLLLLLLLSVFVGLVISYGTSGELAIASSAPTPQLITIKEKCSSMFIEAWIHFNRLRKLT